MEFGIIGSSIWQQNLPLLEKLTVDREKQTEVISELKDALELKELIYLSTCNRVEFIYATRKSNSDNRILHRLIDFFFVDSNDINFFPNDFYHYTGKDAVTHLFRTVSSLESLVVGETQITGQFKDAYENSLSNGWVGITLNKLAKDALLTAKKIKRETTLGNGAQSMASLAAEQLCKQLKKSDKNLIALVGSGEMTDKFARYVEKENLGKLIFVNRSVEKIEKFGKQFNGQVMSLEDFMENPPDVAAIMSSTASSEVIFNGGFIKKLNSDHKVICIDLAVPRDFSTEFDRHHKISLIDVAYLKGQANINIRKKFVESNKANAIVKEAVHKYISDNLEVSIKPIFHNTYKESVELAGNALNDLFNKKLEYIKAEDRETIKNLVNKLIGHSSFQPSKVISEHLAENKSELDLNNYNDNKEAI